jgi:hypothetical protein
VQLAECRVTGEFTVAEPFLFVDRHEKTVQSHSSPLPSTSVQPASSGSLHTLCSLQMALSFDNVSTNLVHIIRENSTGKTPQKFDYPAFSIFPLATKTTRWITCLRCLTQFPSQRCSRQGFTQTSDSCHHSQCAASHPVESSYHSEKARSLWFKAISIISMPSPDEHDSPLRLFHASLGDCLTNRSRCGDTFFLDSGVYIVSRILKPFIDLASGR